MFQFQPPHQGVTKRARSSIFPRAATLIMTKYTDLSERTILITGGANGIGQAMVEAFARQGAHVHFCDIDKKAGEALAGRVGTSTFTFVDLTKESAVRRWIAATAKKRGQIHGLINNAASDPRIPLQKMTSKQWDQLFARNLKAHFLTAQAASPHMKKGASIINFSSITVHVTPAEMTAYVSTKAGIQGFTRSLARELGPLGIRVNTLSPGWVMTPRQLKEFVTPSVKRMIKRVQCIPDLIQPSEIANVALFLASESSSAMTGQELLADRGWAHS
jgi:NAD(P)-dependent dehydrogenase (short-subunit alcohol dehydrogenase family)